MLISDNSRKLQSVLISVNSRTLQSVLICGYPHVPRSHEMAMCHGAMEWPMIFIVINITWNMCRVFTTSSLYLLIQAKVQSKTSARVV